MFVCLQITLNFSSLGLNIMSFDGVLINGFCSICSKNKLGSTRLWPEKTEEHK